MSLKLGNISSCWLALPMLLVACNDTNMTQSRVPTAVGTVKPSVTPGASDTLADSSANSSAVLTAAAPISNGAPVVGPGGVTIPSNAVMLPAATNGSSFPIGGLVNVFASVVGNISAQQQTPQTQQTQQNTVASNNVTIASTSKTVSQVVTVPSENACANPNNLVTKIGGYNARLRPNNYAYLSISILARRENGGASIGEPHAIFPKATQADNNANSGFVGVYYQGGMLRDGRTVWGTLYSPNADNVVYAKLDSGVQVRVGSVVDSNPGGMDYPRLGKIVFDSGACMVQYITDLTTCDLNAQSSDGCLFSAGAGYLLIPK